MPDIAYINGRSTPFLSVRLRCPVCGCLCETSFVSSYGEQFSHPVLPKGEICVNEGKCYAIDDTFCVSEIPRATR
jgi:hypothetical protein